MFTLYRISVTPLYFLLSVLPETQSLSYEIPVLRVPTTDYEELAEIRQRLNS